MDYSHAVEFLYNRLPMFHRVGKAAYKADLHNTLALCAHLGNPERKFRSVHVAGTNGKGSVSHMLAAILQSAGYRTGLYTSPHLKSFTERIRVDGNEIPPEAVADFVERHQTYLDELQPSFFEMTVGMAFDYFARQHVDIAVVEVGLGGRLDSTNVITPVISVITNISYDHQDLLGDTLPEIAAEKAGIIKPNVPVVVSEFQPEVAPVFEAKAQQQSAPLQYASEAYRVVPVTHTDESLTVDVYRHDVLHLTNLTCPLTGTYQFKNIPGVLQAGETLNAQNFGITEAAIRKGIGHVTTLTGLKGRWQVLQQHPLVVCDTGHNEAGIREVVREIGRHTYEKLYCVIGVVNDKDLRHILPVFPTDAYYFFCQAQIPRALPAEALQTEAAVYGLRGEAVPDVNEAIRRAVAQAHTTDIVFIGGSTFVVAEVDAI